MYFLQQLRGNVVFGAKKEYNLWFGAKESPTCGVTCYFL
jgi:hypothetical protein